MGRMRRIHGDRARCGCAVRRGHAPSRELPHDFHPCSVHCPPSRRHDYPSLNRAIRHRLLIYLLLLVGLLAAGAGVLPVSAQKADSTTVDSTHPETTTHPAPSSLRKSPSRAVLHSAGGPIVLTPLFGPAVGHFYAEDDAQAWRGIGLRVGGFGVDCGFGIVGLGQASVGAHTSGLTAADVTLTVVAIQALYDVVTARHSAKEYSESLDLSARVTPAVGPQGEQAGLALQVSFSTYRSRI